MFYLETLVTSKDLLFTYFSVFLTYEIRKIGYQLNQTTFWFIGNIITPFANFVSLVENNL